MSSSQKSTIPLPMRLIAILLGVVFLFWLPFEDSSTTPAHIFALALSSWIAIVYLVIPHKPFSAPLPNHILAGTLVGIVIMPLTLFIMAFKSGLHSHTAPDFTSQQMLSVIYRTPIWIIGGFLVGLGSGVWRGAHNLAQPTTSEK